ncbi:hypothetical protein GCM10023322_33660 [Rugosimonospora acidiphila]|uniref:MFS transporter n=1 Tax=Rugosimonospora acidiphila TaxID=556531 RepID=A0ABP9RUY2_9ACTN
MVFNLPLSVWILVAAGAIGIPAATCVVLYRAAVATGRGRRAGAGIAVAAGAGFAAWIVVDSLLAHADVYRQDPATLRVWMPFALVGPLLVALLATRIPVMSRILADPGTPARLAVPQTLRVVGVVFFIVLALHKLPPVFALPAGLGDVAVGISAPFVARRLAAGGGRRGAVWFNALGILDLVVALGTGFLAALAPHRILAVRPSTEALGLLPLTLIPTAAVPVALALHVVSLRRLSVVARSIPVAARSVANLG